jgi:hypothetical protein
VPRPDAEVSVIADAAASTWNDTPAEVCSTEVKFFTKPPVLCFFCRSGNGACGGAPTEAETALHAPHDMTRGALVAAAGGAKTRYAGRRGGGAAAATAKGAGG